MEFLILQDWGSLRFFISNGLSNDGCWFMTHMWHSDALSCISDTLGPYDDVINSNCASHWWFLNAALHILKSHDHFSFLFLLFFLLSRTVHVAHGSSQARGGIRATAASYATATAMRDPSRVWDLHHSSKQLWILNPLGEAGDRACILMDTSQVLYHWATMGTLPRRPLFE